MQKLKAFYHLIKHYIPLLFFWKKPRIKFVVFAQGRTGSTLLVELINQLENVHCEGELFNKNFFPFKKKAFCPFLFLKAKSRSKNKAVFGFKIKIYQITEDQKQDPGLFIKKLVDRGYKIIFLYRKDIVKQVISNMLAVKNKKFHLYENEKFEFKPFYVDPLEFKNTLEQRKAYHVIEKKVLEDFDHLTLSYEEDLLDNTSHIYCIEKICDFLEIQSNPVRASLRKANKYSMKEIIENYKDLENLIESKNKEYMLE